MGPMRLTARRPLSSWSKATAKRSQEMWFREHHALSQLSRAEKSELGLSFSQNTELPFPSLMHLVHSLLFFFDYFKQSVSSLYFPIQIPGKFVSITCSTRGLPVASSINSKFCTEFYNTWLKDLPFSRASKQNIFLWNIHKIISLSSHLSWSINREGKKPKNKNKIPLDLIIQLLI